MSNATNFITSMTSAYNAWTLKEVLYYSMVCEIAIFTLQFQRFNLKNSTIITSCLKLARSCSWIIKQISTSHNDGKYLVLKNTILKIVCSQKDKYNLPPSHNRRSLYSHEDYLMKSF